MSKLNQYTLTIHLQKTDNSKLSTTEIKEIKNMISFNLSYALKGTLLHEIDLTLKGDTK